MSINTTFISSPRLTVRFCRIVAVGLISLQFFGFPDRVTAQPNCTPPCCCPDVAICYPPDPDDCSDEGACEDKYGNPVECPDDGGGGGGEPEECLDKFGMPIACPPDGGGCDCCDPNSSGYDPNVATAASCGPGDDENCDCDDMEPSISIILSGFPPCPSGSPNPLQEWIPPCGPKAELNCNGDYSLVYAPGTPNAKILGACVYDNGWNTGALYFTKNKCKLVASVFYNMDFDSSGDAVDEGTKNKYDWTVYKAEKLPGPVDVKCYEGTRRPPQGQGDSSTMTSPCE